MKAPAFWTRNGLPARMLSPLSCIGTAITAHRMAHAGWRAPVPVICCGNASVGGAGKTTLALDLAHRLTARGVAVHVLLRGYRGSARGPRRVLRGDTAAVTGDEALLLAEAAPTWTGADRAASARVAIAAGAELLLMDDGLQNPSLEKTMSLLVVDGSTGFGNGRVMPAGPLREPVAAAASRCRAAVLIGPDTSGALARLPPDLPVLRAGLVQGDEIASLTGHRVLAFAGIAFPAKFFTALERAGVVLVGREAFADHHAYTANQLARLAAKARALNAILVTTPKDAVRLPAEMNPRVVSVRLVWEAEPAIDALLDELMSGRSLTPPPRDDRSVA
jgi:tetraacyldisaccharide 4'-kinase